MDLGRKQTLNEPDNDVFCSWQRAWGKSQSLHRKVGQSMQEYLGYDPQGRVVHQYLVNHDNL